MGGLFFLGKDWVSFKMSLNNEIAIDPKYWKSFKKDSYRQDEENQGGPGKKRVLYIESAWARMSVCWCVFREFIFSAKILKLIKFLPNGLHFLKGSSR